MADTFCPVPWNFQAIQNNGCVRVCCQMNQTADRGTLLKDDNTPYNAEDDNLDDARNAPLIKEVRQHMLNGKWHPSCTRCHTEEQSGLSSRRTLENKNWNTYTKEWAKQVTDDDGFLDITKSPLVYYDLRFGNLCNLACRMCGPEDSHTWYKDHVAMEGPEFFDTHGKVTLIKNNKGRWSTNRYDWHYSESFWNQLELNISNIRHVYLAGGEPLLIERHYDFLQKCINSNVAKDIVLEYNTNLTNISKRVTDMWIYFKEVRIGASIDGIGDVLEYQRYPVKWSLIEKNLRILDDLPDNVYAWIACTITTLNVFQIPDFMKWKLEQNFKKINSLRGKPIISIHVAHRPWTSSIRILTPKLKSEVVDYYESKRSEFDIYGDHIAAKANEILDSIIKYMNDKDESKQHIGYFIDFTNQLDKLRNQQITQVVPQYTELFNSRNKY